MQSCGLVMIRYLLYIFNIVIAIYGIGLLTANSFIVSYMYDYRHFLAGNMVLKIAGFIVLIVAALGVYGSIRESYYLLVAYAVCVVVIFITEFLAGIVVTTYKNEFRNVLKDVLINSMNNYETNEYDKNAWDYFHTKFECCGVDGPTDWKIRPLSCCHNTTENALPPTLEQCENTKPGDEFLYTYGCFDKLKIRTAKFAKFLIGAGIGVAFIQIIGIISACWLASAVKNNEINCEKIETEGALRQ